MSGLGAEEDGERGQGGEIEIRGGVMVVVTGEMVAMKGELAAVGRLLPA